MPKQITPFKFIGTILNMDSTQFGQYHDEHIAYDIIKNLRSINGFQVKRSGV